MTPGLRADADSATALCTALALAMALWISAPIPAVAQDADKPRPTLACSDLAKLAGQWATGEEAVAGENDVIEAEGPVSALDGAAIPPYLVLCDGSPRIACVMETPLPDVATGTRVHVMGRLSEGDSRMLVIDPCGATRLP